VASLLGLLGVKFLGYSCFFVRYRSCLVVGCSNLRLVVLLPDLVWDGFVWCHAGLLDLPWIHHGGHGKRGVSAPSM
jgi:hypothetical protein